MRREFIYPHRSVRSFPVSGLRLFAALGMAVILTALVAHFGATILDRHNQLSSYVLERTRVASTAAMVDVFPYLGPVPAPDLPFPAARANRSRTAIIFCSFLSALMLIHWRFPLSRNFIVFVVVLLCAAGAAIIVRPSYRFDAVMFGQMWLRGEFLVWVLLPWVSAFLFILTLPSVAGGVAWTLLIEVYAIVWSALRFAFCLGVLHFTGMLLFPMLWFCLGILFDLVYVLTFFSLALRFSMKRAVGERQS